MFPRFGLKDTSIAMLKTLTNKSRKMKIAFITYLKTRCIIPSISLIWELYIQGYFSFAIRTFSVSSTIVCVFREAYICSS